MSNFQQGFALIIGIGNDLPMTIQDAEVVYEALSDPTRAAYPKENILYVTGRDATRKNIEKALDDIIAMASGVDNSTVVVYYSGHGAQVPWNDGKNHYFLVPNDAKNTDINSLLPAEIFTKKINEIQSDKLLVLLDCCHAEGQHATGEPVTKNFMETTRSGAPISKGSNEKLLKALQGGEGKIFIASCKDEEQSYIARGDKNSLFTKHLVRALEGDNSSFYDFVHVLDVIQYLFRNVPSEAKAKLKVSQTPIINYANKLDAEFFICANNQGKAPEEMQALRSHTKKSQEEINSLNEEVQEKYKGHLFQLQGNEIHVGTGDVNIGNTNSNNSTTIINNNYYGNTPPVTRDNNSPDSKNTDAPADLEKINDLIYEDEVIDAIDLLMELTEKKSDIRTLRMSKSRWNAVMRDIDEETVSKSDANISKNKIKKTLFNIIEKMEN